MIFESIAAVTAALSAVNGLIGQVKESGGHIGSVLDRMQAINSGMQKLEIEKRESLVQPLTPQEAMKLAMAKRQMDRFHEELRNMAVLSRDHQKFVDDYFQVIAESKAQHEASVKAVTALVAPGPEVTSKIPGFPLDLAYPSAACPAPCLSLIHI